MGSNVQCIFNAALTDDRSPQRRALVCAHAIAEFDCYKMVLLELITYCEMVSEIAVITCHLCFIFCEDTDHGC